MVCYLCLMVIIVGFLKMICNKILFMSLILLVVSCTDSRKCLKSHMETSCSCACINNIGVPMHNQYEVCELYEEDNK